jgi:hypothetical protein
MNKQRYKLTDLRDKIRSFHSSCVFLRIFVVIPLLPSTFLVRYSSVSEAVEGTVWLTASPR